MLPETPKLFPIAGPSDSRPIATPFEGDLFLRKELADRLTALLRRLPEGGALAIHAAWGDGKTWFGRHWNAHLKSEGFRTIYLDAFESDYVEDPFLLLAAEFKALAESGGSQSSKTFGARAVAVGRVMIPALAKGALGAVGRLATGTDIVDSIEEGLAAGADTLGDEIGGALKEHLNALQGRKETVNAFKQSLQSLASAGGSPIVVFIDELDRCSPAFAVRMLERAKHFFQVSGVVFVVLINRDQLEAAIRGVYGAETNAALYLHKFLTLTLTLPKPVDLDWSSSSFALRHIQSVGSHLGLSELKYFDAYARSLALFAQRLHMSYRDTERACTYLALYGEDSMASPLIAYLSALRIARPRIFRGIASGAIPAHQQALEEIKGWRTTGHEFWLLRLLECAHAAVCEPQRANTDEELQAGINDFRRELGLRFTDVSAATFEKFCSRMEIAVG